MLAQRWLSVPLGGRVSSHANSELFQCSASLVSATLAVWHSAGLGARRAAALPARAPQPRMVTKPELPVKARGNKMLLLTASGDGADTSMWQSNSTALEL